MQIGGLTDGNGRFVRECRNLREHTSHADVFGKLNDLGVIHAVLPLNKGKSLKQCEELKSFARCQQRISILHIASESKYFADKSREEDLGAGTIQAGDAELNLFDGNARS
jgi:hypothetical protein